MSSDKPEVPWIKGMEELVKPLEKLADYRPPRWAWPVTLLVLGAGAFGMSWVFSPVSDTVVAFMGNAMHGSCSFVDATGLPCPSCGMTRSWVHSARGNLITGFLFNPAGALLFWWLVVGGILGAARLVTRNYDLAKVHSGYIAAWAVFWMVVPYSLLWILRISLGVNPLPGW